MNDHKSNLLAKIAAKEATVAVIGLGYVGLPLAIVFEEAGFPVIGVLIESRGLRMPFVCTPEELLGENYGH